METKQTVAQADSFRMVGAVRVDRCRLIGGDVTIYSAWRRTGPDHRGRAWSHHNITTFGTGRWWGRIGTEDLPADLDAMPAGDARVAAVTAWQAARDAEADALILRAYPEAATGIPKDGERVVYGEEG